MIEILESQFVSALSTLRKEISPEVLAPLPSRQHVGGKLEARERLNALFDSEPTQQFQEIGALREHSSRSFGLADKKWESDGVITGYGRILGREVFAASQNFLVGGGSVGPVHAAKICSALKLSINTKSPFIFINDSGGARIQEGVASLAGYGNIFHLNTKASGLIPQISLIMGPCAGGAVYAPALTDFIIMVEGTSYMFLTGPNVVKKVTYEDVTAESMGGSYVHSQKSGVADFVASDDIEACLKLRHLLSFIPNNCFELPPFSAPLKDTAFDIRDLVPEDKNLGYDVRSLILSMIDDRDFLEVKKEYAQNIVIGFARIEGLSVGIVANQPSVLAGCIDINASCKAARFIRFCDSFNIPIVSLVDVPGFLPGTKQEYSGIICHGAKLLHAYSEATVPKIAIITRKAYGGAYIVMSSKHLGTDFNFAWANSEIAVMGLDGAAEVLLKGSPTQAQFASFKKEYSEISSAQSAAKAGYIDDVIDPSTTRDVLVSSLRVLRAKHSPLMHDRKHSNIPL